MDTVLNIQPRIGGGGGGPTPDEVVLSKQSDLLSQLPELLDRSTGKKELFKEKNGLLTSLTTVLLLEMEKFNRLLGVMKRSLIDLDKAIHGFIVMSEVLDKMYLSLQNGRVPDNWTAVGYNSLKPLAPWYTDLLDRVAMFRLWLEDG
jgi:dynein heavy chain